MMKSIEVALDVLPNAEKASLGDKYTVTAEVQVVALDSNLVDVTSFSTKTADPEYAIANPRATLLVRNLVFPVSDQEQSGNRHNTPVKDEL